MKEQTILLVSDDAVFCSAMRRRFASGGKNVRVSAVSTVVAARRIIQDAPPEAILVDETGITSEAPSSDTAPFDSLVSALAIHAPVIVIGDAKREIEIAALVTAGLADFVPRTQECLPLAVNCIERRLRKADRGKINASFHNVLGEASNGQEPFGEVLRHELNNPLTGILGNAELLLAEVRRQNNGFLPQDGQKRLETIADLAVRLRETVRRLSADWDARYHPVP